MTRKEKLKLLHGIKNGNLTIECLQPPQVYIFVERSNEPGIYSHNRKQYNQTEYNKFCEKIRVKNNGSVIWKEGKNYLKEDTVITICRANKI